MKKFLITIIVLLIILAFGQAIYYNIKPMINPTENISSSSSTDEVLEGNNFLYDNYNPTISYATLKNRINTLIKSDFPEVLKNIYNKNVEGIKQYYEENTDKIQKMYIYEEEEFISIAKQLQNVYNDQQEIANVIDCKINTNSIIYTLNGLISFDMIFYYDNEITVQIKITLSETEESMIIASASNLDKIFESYSVSVGKSEFLGKLESFIQSVRNIRQDSTLKTENEKTQYYDLNKEKLNNIGIYSAEDYITIADQINTMNWIHPNISFINFDADKKSITTDADYINFVMKLYYTYDSETDINIKLKVNNNSNEPSIKFSGVAVGEN